MNSANPRLKIRVLWFDDDMLELGIQASNDEFSGRVHFYAPLDAPAAFAEKIQGFPRDAFDVREYEFGENNLPGYGSARIRLSCTDRLGHLRVQVTMQKNSANANSKGQGSDLYLHTVPAAIDAFVEDLVRMRVRVGEAAVLMTTT